MILNAISKNEKRLSIKIEFILNIIITKHFLFHLIFFIIKSLKIILYKISSSNILSFIFTMKFIKIFNKNLYQILIIF